MENYDMRINLLAHLRHDNYDYLFSGVCKYREYRTLKISRLYWSDMAI